NIPITESQSFNFTPTQIVSAANVLNAKIESTKNVPSTVTVAGVMEKQLKKLKKAFGNSLISL
ncbi:MAG: hypothetical protein ACC609_07655, partial [Methanobacterium formicicum]